MMPYMSEHFKRRKPSAIRLAQIEFMKREDDVKAVNVAIGNVSLPMHRKMIERMKSLGSKESPFKDGQVMYTATVGLKETNDAFLNIISSSGFDTKGLYSQITDGGSQAMELVILGVCGAAGKDERPLLLIDAAYTNYVALSERLGRKTISITRTLGDDGKFTLPDEKEIENVIIKNKPGAVVVIPYDNPTGQFFDKELLVRLSRIFVKHNMWIISDEAYRELFYVDKEASSIWGVSETDVPGITGRRISIETASKVWNACGLRIGAIVTDNKEFHEKSVAENTASLCPNIIGQWIFGSLAHESHKDLQRWYKLQRDYYSKMMRKLNDSFKKELPGIIISSPDASIYSVVDVRKIAKEGFDALDFVMFCTQKGKVRMGKEELTLLVSPMAGFYSVAPGKENPGKTQMRIAFVETPENMEKVPVLFKALFEEYESNR
ncbi:MAG: aminotransferase class I/II-fold pyridoxal phosphate-dependent enzyme [archaeon]